MLTTLGGENILPPARYSVLLNVYFYKLHEITACAVHIILILDL